MQRVVKDPTHPDFPHGTPRGYTRGCHDTKACPATPSCATQRARALKRNAVRRIAGINGRVAPDHTRARVRLHLATLQNVAAATKQVARASGVTERTINRVLAGGLISPESARRLLSTTPAQVTAECGTVQARHLTLLARQMQAQGWPLSWQAAQDARLRWLTAVANRDGNKLAGKDALEALKAVAARVGDRHATPEDGIRPDASKRAKFAARRAGVYPAVCYDGGVLNLRAIPDHPWSKFDDRAARRLETLRLYLTGGRTLAETSEAARVTVREVERVAHDAGIAGMTGKQRWAKSKELLAGIYAYQDGHLDVVHAALNLGIVIPPGQRHADIMQQHPGYLAWLQEQKPQEAAA